MEYGKYIIANKSGTECAILFDETFSHKEMAGNFVVVSAGIFNVQAEPKKDNPLNVDVWAGGRSITLNVNSRGEEDAEIIKRVLQYEGL